jgi:hypothetical protein
MARFARHFIEDDAITSQYGGLMIRLESQTDVKRPGSCRALWTDDDAGKLESVKDLIGPETLQPLKRLVQGLEIIRTNATNLVD